VTIKYSSGKYTQAACDRCAEWFKLSKLRKIVLKDNVTNIKVCPRCWEPSHPQLRLGQYPVVDPQAVREPRPDSPETDVHSSPSILWGNPAITAMGLPAGYLIQENGGSLLLDTLAGYDIITQDGYFVFTQNDLQVNAE